MKKGSALTLCSRFHSNEGRECKWGQVLSSDVFLHRMGDGQEEPP